MCADPKSRRGEGDAYSLEDNTVCQIEDRAVAGEKRGQRDREKGGQRECEKGGQRDREKEVSGTVFSYHFGVWVSPLLL